MNNLKATILKMSVYPEGDNPDYGECATHIEIDDEPGFSGANSLSLVIKQSFDSIRPGTIRVTLPELEKLTAIAREMVHQYPHDDAI